MIVGISHDYGYYYIQRSSSASHSDARPSRILGIFDSVLEISKPYPKLHKKLQIDYASYLVSEEFTSGQISRTYFHRVKEKLCRYSDISFLTIKQRYMLNVCCYLPELLLILRLLKKIKKLGSVSRVRLR